MDMAAITDAEARRNIAANIRRLLNDYGWSQRELARRSRESAMNVSRIINEVNLPNAALAARIADALGVKVDDLLSRNSKKTA
jgi:transcriptional regulator with XRE-family HTH domain